MARSMAEHVVGENHGVQCLGGCRAAKREKTTFRKVPSRELGPYRKAGRSAL
jgi:hypothetical protein